MHPRSLGLSTDLQLLALRGKVIDRGDYLVGITPEDPGYYYGNLLVHPAPPQIGEVAFWTRRFAEEFPDPEILHVTFLWDGITGDVGARDELLAAGFTIEVVQTMTARSRDLAPALPQIEDIAIRALAPDELTKTADLGFTIGDRHDDAYRRFLDRRAAWQARLVAGGSARFWGAFDGDTLVGSLGLVSLGDVARYQDVQTAATHRRRGIASALLGAAARGSTCETVVIQVLPASDANRVYRRAGFQTIEHTASACRYPSPVDQAHMSAGVAPLSE